MINVIASIRIKEGCLPRFIEIFKSNIPHVLEEKGCIEYTAAMDLPSGLPIQEMDDHVVTVIEKWNGLADLEAHLAAPHMIAYREKTAELVEDISIKVLSEV